MIDPGLRERVAVVTGIDNPRGIGWTTAVALARHGAAVLGTYFEGSANQLEERTLEIGGRIRVMYADLREPGTIQRIFDCAEASLGPVEILINNACANRLDTFLPPDPGAQDWAGRHLETLTPEGIDNTFAVNSRAVALMMAEFAARAHTRDASWGRIINVSTDGAFAFPGEISYGASKWALESYSRAAARELADCGITVNIVSPGPTDTGWIPPELTSGLAAGIPLGRVGQPEDIADVIVYLASEQARWLTGQTLHAGGGHRM